MRNATKSTSPPGGSTRKHGMDRNQWSVGGAFSTTSQMSTPPKTPDEESDEDATMLKNLMNATDKYEAAIAIQPQAARLLNTHSNTNKNRHLNTSAYQAGGRNQHKDEDGYESDNIGDKDIDDLKKLRTNQHSHTTNRDDCIDDFITYNVTPALQRRSSPTECCNDTVHNQWTRKGRGTTRKSDTINAWNHT